MKKVISMLLIFSMFIFTLDVSVLASERSTDLVSKENQQIVESNNAIQPMVALPYPVYFIPGIGQAALIGTGAVIVGGITFKASSWVAKAVNSFLKAETADQIISKKKKGSIRKEFPSEYLNKTLNQIEKDAKKGNAKARKAKKLLNEKRFDK